MGKLIAQIPIATWVDGERVVIEPGEEVPGLSEHDAAELLGSKSVIDPDAVAAVQKKAAVADAQARRAFDAERAAVIAAQKSITPNTPASGAVATGAGVSPAPSGKAKVVKP